MNATLIAVLAVEGACPKGLVDRLGGPFDKGFCVGACAGESWLCTAGHKKASSHSRCVLESKRRIPQECPALPRRYPGHERGLMPRVISDCYRGPLPLFDLSTRRGRALPWAIVGRNRGWAERSMRTRHTRTATGHGPSLPGRCPVCWEARKSRWT